MNFYCQFFLLSKSQHFIQFNVKLVILCVKIRGGHGTARSGIELVPLPIPEIKTNMVRYRIIVCQI